MAKASQPRHGSMQFWPRVRAKRIYARIRTWPKSSETKPLGFAGIKAGMTHIIMTDNGKHSPTKGQDLAVPVTILECPPLVVAGVRFYKQAKKGYGEAAATEVRFKPNKFLPRKTTWKPTGDLEKVNADDYTRAVLLVHTQPDKTGIAQKTPHIFELGFGGTVADVVAFAKENKEIAFDQVFQEGQFIDTHAVTTGKGTQGPVKRFGIGLRSHRSEKSRRRAVLGTMGNAKVTPHVPQEGKMGYHLRTEYNKQILKITTPEDIQVNGGIVNYGNVKATTVLIKGSIAGPKKRMITLTVAARPDPKKSAQAPTVQHIATRSQQGNQ